MKHLPIIFLLSTAVILFGGIFWFSQKKSVGEIASSNTSAGTTFYEYFWGIGCPHCANVEEFLDSWDKKDSLQIEKLEVNSNRANANRLIQRGNACNLPKNEIGTIPLLVTPKGECISGDTPIIEYLKSL